MKGPIDFPAIPFLKRLIYKLMYPAIGAAFVILLIEYFSTSDIAFIYYVIVFFLLVDAFFYITQEKYFITHIGVSRKNSTISYMKYNKLIVNMGEVVIEQATLRKVRSNRELKTKIEIKLQDGKTISQYNNRWWTEDNIQSLFASLKSVGINTLDLTKKK